MKKIILCIFTLLVMLPAAFGGQLQERVYIATDRDVYVAGDCVWMSAWCVDASTGTLSDFSRTAYVELHSPAGTVQTAKIALSGGRGAGTLSLPNTLDTGNYSIIAYTMAGASEKDFDPSTGERIISVFNTFSTARIDGGVTVVDQAPEAIGRSFCGPLAIKSSGKVVRVTNNGSRKALFSLSVHHSDGIPSPESRSIEQFCTAVKALPAGGGADPDVLEYEGEIIRARVTGTDAAGIRALEGKVAFISSPGDGSNVYTSSIEPDGSVTFYTSNIFDEQDMFLEIEGVERDNVCHLEIERPFRDFAAGDIPVLPICSGYAEALRLRSLGMQLEHNFDDPELYTPLPYYSQAVFEAKRCKVYKLDDYTRFPVMEELFTEFIPELRIRRNEGVRELQVRISDPVGNTFFSSGTALVLLDGVPVLDHEKIFAYDPLLVQRIEIFPDSYFLGIRSFRGVVNFVTYKGTLPSVRFEDNVRIVTFQGCSLPLAYTGENTDAEYPDYRQTIWWHPLLELAPGETLEIECKSPAYTGDFRLSVEGLDDQGSPVCTGAELRF